MIFISWSSLLCNVTYKLMDQKRKCSYWSINSTDICWQNPLNSVLSNFVKPTNDTFTAALHSITKYYIIENIIVIKMTKWPGTQAEKWCGQALQHTFIDQFWWRYDQGLLLQNLPLVSIHAYRDSSPGFSALWYSLTCSQTMIINKGRTIVMYHKKIVLICRWCDSLFDHTKLLSSTYLKTFMDYFTFQDSSAPQQEGIITMNVRDLLYSY